MRLHPYRCSHCGEQGHGVNTCTKVVTREEAAWRAFYARLEHGENSAQYKNALGELRAAHRRFDDGEAA